MDTVNGYRAHQNGKWSRPGQGAPKPIETLERREVRNGFTRQNAQEYQGRNGIYRMRSIGSPPPPDVSTDTCQFGRLCQ